MLTPEIISAWKYSDLKAWLKTSKNGGEDSEFDLKRQLTPQNGKDARKDFSSFANTRGGFIFYGINNDFTICGCDECDINRQIPDYLAATNLDPSVGWSLIKAFEVPKVKKFVYTIFIKQSNFLKRPHVSDGVIYIRDGNESRGVKTLSELRQLFWNLQYFVPQNIQENFSAVISHIKQINYQLAHIGTAELIYLMRLKKFLHDIKETEKLAETEKLETELEDILKNMGDLEKESPRVSDGATVLFTDKDTDGKKGLIQRRLEDFEVNFRETFL